MRHSILLTNNVHVFHFSLAHWPTQQWLPALVELLWANSHQRVVGTEAEPSTLYSRQQGTGIAFRYRPEPARCLVQSVHWEPTAAPPLTSPRVSELSVCF